MHNWIHCPTHIHQAHVVIRFQVELNVMAEKRFCAYSTLSLFCERITSVLQPTTRCTYALYPLGMHSIFLFFGMKVEHEQIKLIHRFGMYFVLYVTV